VTVRQQSDSELLALITQKNEAALVELYDRYNRLVYSLAMSVVGEQASAEEVTLDIFTRVWEKAHTYQVERAKVYTWLTRMTRNRSIDHLRRESVRPMKYSLAWAEISKEPADNTDGPEAAVQLAIQRKRVREAVATLPDAQKEVIALAYFKGFSHSEIARELNLPLGTVKGRIRSAMVSLRTLIQEK